MVDRMGLFSDTLTHSVLFSLSLFVLLILLVCLDSVFGFVSFVLIISLCPHMLFMVNITFLVNFYP